VNREGLQYTVLLHSGLRHYFLSHLDHYDDKQLYKDQVPVSTDEMDKVMESVDKDLSLTPQARNLLHFFLVKVFFDLASSCIHFLTFAKRSSLDGRCLMGAVFCKFQDSVAQSLRIEIVRVMKTLGKDLDKVEATETEPAVEAEPSADTTDGADATTSKKKTPAKTVKATTPEKKVEKKSTTIDTDVDETVEEDQGGDGSNDEEVKAAEPVAEETVVEEPKPKKSKNTTATATANASSSNNAKKTVKK